MGRGRKSKPTELKLVRDNPGKRPINKKEPKPKKVAEDFPPPDWLSDRAEEEWRRNLADPAVRAYITEADLPVFADYCHAYAIIQECEDYLRDKGRTYESTTVQGGLMRRIQPEARLQADAMKMLKSCAENLGFTPSARSRVSAPGKPKDEKEKRREKFYGQAAG